MSLSRLNSIKPAEVRDVLWGLLNTITEIDVLNFDREFEATLTANAKHALLATFEASESVSLRNPQLLKKWAHYCWLKLELFQLANQKALFNKYNAIAAKNDFLVSKIFYNTPKNKTTPPLTATEVKKAYDEDISGKKARGFSLREFQARLNSEPERNIFHEIPAITESIDLAIQESARQNIPITKAIEALNKILLQIVGTEHPTDPLSQDARDTISKLAVVINAKEIDESHLKELFIHLQKADPIPAAKRSVVEEVNRDISFTLDKLYDTLPNFINTVLKAFRNYYGESAYLLQENAIWEALTKCTRDASWAGFDADGNINVTYKALTNAIRLHRIRAVEKHIHALDHQIIKLVNEIETRTAREILGLNLAIFSGLQSAVSDINANSELIMGELNRLQSEAIESLFISKNLDELVTNYQSQKQFLEGLQINADYKEKLIKLLLGAIRNINYLIDLNILTGSLTHAATKHPGVLPPFKKILDDYKETIREDSDAIKIDNIDATQFVTHQFQHIITSQSPLLIKFPELARAMKIFNIQLHSFGMTYGVGHIRQDSAVFRNVWNTIFEDLKNNPHCKHFKIIASLGKKNYLQLHEHERLHIQQTLLSNDPESIEILKTIAKTQNGTYAPTSLIFSELERIKTAIHHADIIENIIISNSETSTNILEVESLIRIFTPKNPIRIVPLLEKPQDLENYEAILIDYIKFKIASHIKENLDKPELKYIFDTLNIKSKNDVDTFIQEQTKDSFRLLLDKNADLKELLAPIVIEIMVGFSDTERMSGLAALIPVQKVQELFIILAWCFGVEPKIFHGPGGDSNRGGLYRRDQKATLQGYARTKLLNSAISTNKYRGEQFYQAFKNASNTKQMLEFSYQPHFIYQAINECRKLGQEFYEHLHDTNTGLGKLLGFMLGRGVHWLVNILNSSSRATQRDTVERLDRTTSVQTGGVRPESYVHPDKPRAISATQMKRLLGDCTDVLMGPGYALRMLGEQAIQLYDASETIRDMFQKTLLGLSQCNFEMARYALFGDNAIYIPKNDHQRQAWAKECREVYPSMLTNINMEAFVKDSQNHPRLMAMLARLFAYIEEEYLQTRAFIFNMLKAIHFPHYRTTKQIQHNTDLLQHDAAWQEEIIENARLVQPISYILARINFHVAEGKNLDQLFLGLNEQHSQNSKLSGVAYLLGCIGNAMIASIAMPETYPSVKPNLRLGVQRASKELGMPRQIGFEDKPQPPGSNFKLFITKNAQANIETVLKKLPETTQKYRV